MTLNNVTASNYPINKTMCTSPKMILIIEYGLFFNEANTYLLKRKFSVG